ncbi:MAG: aminoglycoside phosphotransferase family protein [Ginsengibacter sp.]
MIEEIYSAYNIDKDKFEITPIGNGLINQTWRVKNGQHDYILQRINTNVFKSPEAIAHNVNVVAKYLQQKYPSYLFTVPVKAVDGRELIFLEGDGYYRLTNYVKNSHTINTVEEAAQAYEAARLFGQFTKLLSDFPVAELQITLSDFHNLTLRYQQFEEALQSGDGARLNESKEMIDFIKANKNIVDTYENILQNPAFKLRVTHHDTKISNVLFDDTGKGLCVIDLDTLMPGYFISDVGDMMRTYLSPVNEEEKDFSKIVVRDEYFKAVWKGYMSEMAGELSEEEKTHCVYAGKFMIYMQAIRFLTDHLKNDIYYGAKYEGHNFVRAGNQVVLLQRLIEKEDTLGCDI